MGKMIAWLVLLVAATLAGAGCIPFLSGEKGKPQAPAADTPKDDPRWAQYGQDRAAWEAERTGLRGEIAAAQEWAKEAKEQAAKPPAITARMLVTAATGNATAGEGAAWLVGLGLGIVAWLKRKKGGK